MVYEVWLSNILLLGNIISYLPLWVKTKVQVKSDVTMESSLVRINLVFCSKASIIARLTWRTLPMPRGVLLFRLTISTRSSSHAPTPARLMFDAKLGPSLLLQVTSKSVSVLICWLRLFHSRPREGTQCHAGEVKRDEINSSWAGPQEDISLDPWSLGCGDIEFSQVIKITNQALFGSNLTFSHENI